MRIIKIDKPLKYLLAAPAAFLLAAAVQAAVVTPPDMPLLYYGAVSLDNQAAAPGTIISASRKTDNLIIASSTVSQNGKYFLEVSCKNYLGQTLIFRINDLPARQDQCRDVNLTPSVRLDLNFNGASQTASPPRRGSSGGRGSWRYADDVSRSAIATTTVAAPIKEIALTATTAPAIKPGETVKAGPIIEPQVLGVKYYANNSLIRGKDHKIYLIDHDRLIVIRNYVQLLRYKGQKIYDVPDDVIRQYMEFKDGSLIRGPDQKIYVLKNGKKQYIPNLKALLKYQGQIIHNVSQEILMKY